MALKIESKTSVAKNNYEKWVSLIFGLVFTAAGILLFTTNLPKALTNTNTQYQVRHYQSQTKLTNNENNFEKIVLTLPSYSLLFFPVAFISGGLMSLAFSFRKNKLVTFFSGLFTLSLGLSLTFFFKSMFPLVLIPITFSVIGFLIIVFFIKGEIK